MSTGKSADDHGSELGVDAPSYLWYSRNLPIDDPYPSVNTNGGKQRALKTIKQDLRRNGFIGAGLYLAWKVQMHILNKLRDNIFMLLRGDNLYKSYSCTDASSCNQEGRSFGCNHRRPHPKEPLGM